MTGPRRDGPGTGSPARGRPHAGAADLPDAFRRFQAAAVPAKLTWLRPSDLDA